MMLAEEIRNNWAASAAGYAAEIVSITRSGYKGWTIKTENTLGVALPIDEGIVVSERFAGANLYTDKIILAGNVVLYALVLTSQADSSSVPFSTLCAELVNPGNNGEFRNEILRSPTVWWMEWKELLGNKNVDERVYDVLGELLTVKYLASIGENAEWNGPSGATYDIDCDSSFYEVKSTISRSKREIVLSNLFQLDPPANHRLFLVLCQFESAQSGISINSTVKELESMGYSSVVLNQKLESLGLERGKSVRNRQYILHSMLQYTVDASFPAIRESSFAGGHLPKGIISITYKVSLDGLDAVSLINYRQASDNDDL